MDKVSAKKRLEEIHQRVLERYLSDVDIKDLLPYLSVGEREEYLGLLKIVYGVVELGQS